MTASCIRTFIESYLVRRTAREETHNLDIFPSSRPFGRVSASHYVTSTSRDVPEQIAIARPITSVQYYPGRHRPYWVVAAHTHIDWRWN
jgi:hypothetical protein